MILWQSKSFTASLLTSIESHHCGSCCLPLCMRSKPCCLACRVRLHTYSPPRSSATLGVQCAVCRETVLPYSFLPTRGSQRRRGVGVDLELCDWSLSVACSSSSAHPGIMFTAFLRGPVLAQCVVPPSRCTHERRGVRVMSHSAVVALRLSCASLRAIPSFAAIPTFRYCNLQPGSLGCGGNFRNVGLVGTSPDFSSSSMS